MSRVPREDGITYISIKVTPENKKLLRGVAAARGMTVSQWAVFLAKQEMEGRGRDDGWALLGKLVALIERPPPSKKKRPPTQEVEAGPIAEKVAEVVEDLRRPEEVSDEELARIAGKVP